MFIHVVVISILIIHAIKIMWWTKSPVMVFWTQVSYTRYNGPSLKQFMVLSHLVQCQNPFIGRWPPYIWLWFFCLCCFVSNDCSLFHKYLGLWFLTIKLLLLHGSLKMTHQINPCTTIHVMLSYIKLYWPTCEKNI